MKTKDINQEFKSDRTEGQPGPMKIEECEEDHQHLHDGHSHAAEGSKFQIYTPTVVSFVLLVTGIVLDQTKPDVFIGYYRVVLYAIAYFFAGGKVLLQAFRTIKKGEIFNEFSLMGLATIGAFYIGEYAEAVAVMLFYILGEHFQEAAVFKSRRSIKALLDVRPDKATLVINGAYKIVDPKTVKIGDTIQLKAGEKVALDGELLTEKSTFNTSALTGESRPVTKVKGDKILAGMINLNIVIELVVVSLYENSALSKILKLVEQATGRKARTQRFITNFAKVYTPVVVLLALAVIILPYFFVIHYVFNEWLYRALVFLVVSCPCALVISIPLGYFGGIGAASRKGILFKGSDFLDGITKIDTIVLDKTGTLTKGVFKIQKVVPKNLEPDFFLSLVAALESKSTHPIGKAIQEHVKGKYDHIVVDEMQEIPGYGIKGKIDGKTILAGNAKLLVQNHIPYDKEIENISSTIVAVAINNAYSGYITIGDELKEDAKESLEQLYQLGIKEVVILSGDKQMVVETLARQLNIHKYYGELLPEDKVNKIEQLQQQGKKVAFVGDGINDAPAIAMSGLGIAMGALGSDAAIETADVVIQNDQLSQIPTAIKIGKATKSIVWQNISLSFLVKVLVLILGAGGLATMWEAVFADVGVAFLAILNAIRIQRMKF